MQYVGESQAPINAEGGAGRIVLREMLRGGLIEISAETLGKEATLCAAVTAASCQGEAYGQKVLVRDIPHMTLELFRVTSRVRHSESMCCIAH